MRMKPLATTALAMLFAASASMAREDHPYNRFEPASFDEQREAILDALRDDRYREIGEDARRQVLEALDRIGQRLEKVDSVDELDKDSKVALFNDQELINALLTQAAEDSRLICRREQKVGSHRRTTHCLTVAERRRQMENSQEDLRRIQGSGIMPREDARIGGRPGG